MIIIGYGTLDNELRHIICNIVSDKSKKQTAMDIDHHKLGIGPDYINTDFAFTFLDCIISDIVELILLN